MPPLVSRILVFRQSKLDKGIVHPQRLWASPSVAVKPKHDLMLGILKPRLQTNLDVYLCVRRHSQFACPFATCATSEIGREGLLHTALPSPRAAPVDP